MGLMLFSLMAGVVLPQEVVVKPIVFMLLWEKKLQIKRYN